MQDIDAGRVEFLVILAVTRFTPHRSISTLWDICRRSLFLAALGMDMHVHDTYFVVARFHFIMVGGMVMGYMAGLHYWWPKITECERQVCG